MTPSHLLACDVGVLYESLTRRLFGTMNLDETMAARVPAAFMMLVAAWALAGTDFVKLPGVRADLALTAVAKMVKEQDGVVGIENALAPTSADALKAADTVERFVKAYLDSRESESRHTRSRNSASAYESAHIKKAVWTLAYWLGYEHTDIESFGW